MGSVPFGALGGGGGMSCLESSFGTTTVLSGGGSLREKEAMAFLLPLAALCATVGGDVDFVPASSTFRAWRATREHTRHT